MTAHWNALPPSNKATHVRVSPLSVHIGAEIRGVDLKAPLTTAEVAAIRAALLEWKVVFFRDQPMDHRQHVGFARQFGDATPGHVVFGGDEQFPEIYSIAKFRKANSKRGTSALRAWSGWHADITAAVNPPAASILRGVDVPPYGGDTLWTNLAAAYNALSPALRGWLDTLHGEHRYDPPARTARSADYDEEISKNKLAAVHPLVRVHPETGEQVLYVSPGFLKSIVELTPQESERIMHLLWEHAVLPEFTVRFKWEPGSVAFWDNRATAHLAPRDIFDVDFERQFYRVTLMGDVPVGVDGKASKLLEGQPIAPILP
ncbi:MAG: TauD/TfdA dioxygenase family protein [Gammaproteobacteria bacterium]